MTTKAICQKCGKAETIDDPVIVTDKKVLWVCGGCGQKNIRKRFLDYKA